MTLELPKVVRRKKRLGRGIGSGQGAKSGRFEGGQTPLYMRLPKGRGTKQVFASQVKKPIAISVARLNQFEGDAVVGPGQLRKVGMLSSRTETVKLIGTEGLTQKLTVRVHSASAGAQKAVEAVGGKVELIS